MAKIVAIANQKGGVGKTTTAVNLSSCVSALGKKVLIVDLDPQGNTTSGIGGSAGAHSVYEALMGRTPLSACLQSTCVKGLSLIPADIRLAGAELELVELERREYRLREAIDTIRDDFDFIFFDCPPSLGILTLNAFTAADSLLVPLQCEYYAMEGLSDLVETIYRVVANKNPNLKVIRVMSVMYSPRISLQILVSIELIQTFGAVVFDTVIPRNVSLAEAPSFGKPVMYYKKTSTGAKAYLDFGRELIRRVKDEVQAVQKE